MTDDPTTTKGRGVAPGVIDLRGLSFSYGPGRPVLEDVSFTVPTCDFASVIGPNGGGDSTKTRMPAILTAYGRVVVLLSQESLHAPPKSVGGVEVAGPSQQS